MPRPVHALPVRWPLGKYQPELPVLEDRAASKVKSDERNSGSGWSATPKLVDRVRTIGASAVSS